jgi:hypothetical protein
MGLWIYYKRPMIMVARACSLHAPSRQVWYPRWDQSYRVEESMPMKVEWSRMDDNGEWMDGYM